MRKLWDHYEPIDLNDIGQTDCPAPQAKDAPKKRLTLFERLFQWVFAAETSDAPLYERPSFVNKEDTPIRRTPSAHEQQTQLIQQALKDWKASTKYFESVSDPELVDYAVFEMEAAQKRYMYLLRHARNEQLLEK